MVLQQTGEQVESAPVRDAHNDVADAGRGRCRAKQLVVERHGALGTLAAVALCRRKLAREESIKLLSSNQRKKR